LPDIDPFRGVIIAAITPRRQHETSIDLGATLELVDFLGRTGANAIALLGSTGEFVHFALDDRRHMTGFAVKRSRVPLLVNVSHSTLDGAVELAHEAAASGVGGVLLMPPYFFRYSQEAIYTFYMSFAEQMRGELPIYLHNLPAFTNEIELATAQRLLNTGAFAGLKDSSGSWDYFSGLRRTENKNSILIGDDRLFARARLAGADGVISTAACAVPELVLAIEAAVIANNAARVEALDRRLHEFIAQTQKFAAPIGIKEALTLRKIESGAPAIGLGSQETEQRDEFLAWFRAWLTIVQDECKDGRPSGR
jgi:dihydrodipicolinate synthase/N-acetylneuraminate lyase